MKMQTSAGQLRSALGTFRGIINRRNTIPVLGTVKLQSGLLVGTDLDSEIAVAFNGSAYQLGSLPASDFPDFKGPEGERTMTGNLGLVAAMNRIRFAMSSEETRYYLNGVAIINDADGKTLLVATTGHQLAMMPLDAAPEGSIGAIIPRHIVHYLCQRKAEPDGCVFDSERLRARFDFAGVVLTTKLIDGTFPDISRVVPKDPAKLFTADKNALVRTLTRMRAFSGGPFKAVKLSLLDDILTLSMNAGESTATETLSVDGNGGPPAESGFNVDYLISILSGFRGESVTFSADTPFASNATVLTSDNDPLTVLQMPMRV